MHSSLRRPATSHQRSATLQQYFGEDETLASQHSFRSSAPLKNLREDQHIIDDGLPSRWQPFFSPRTVKVVKDGVSRKRNGAGMISRSETLKTIVPSVSELPTLMLANSITPRSSDDAVDEGATRSPITHSHSTPADYATPIPLSIGNVRTEIYADPEPTPRRSFTLSGIFPSPSPSRWKIPRSGSFRKSEGPQEPSNSRRIVSAPHHLRSRQKLSTGESHAQPGNYGNPRQPSEGRNDVSSIDSGFPNADRRIPSSPLPPLNRLSAFEIDLPGAVPSYPTSPHFDNSSDSLKMSSTPPQPNSSPLGAIAFNTVRNKSHRPSGAPSDHASTLLGSEHSRFLSSDEDDADGRSETVYDSTRTGATGSSHSGVRRPPINTVFDEPPPPEISKGKLLALQDLMGHDSFPETSIPRADILEEEENENTSTPVQATAPCKEQEHPTSVPPPIARPLSPDFHSSPPTRSPALNSIGVSEDHLQEMPDDELWSFGDNNDTYDDLGNGIDIVVDKEQMSSKPVSPSSRLPTLPHSVSSTGADRTSKSHLFDWSEQPSSERDSFQGSSPRPKTVHGKNGKEIRGSRLSGRRGASALHLRSQSVPVPSDGGSHRGNGNTSKLEAWVLGNKGVSEDWDGDFEFEEPSPRPNRQAPVSHDYTRTNSSTGMLVPRSIMERQASVHGQFGQVKELTLLVEELKRLQQQAASHGIMQGQSVELWKEAEGIINLATVDDEEQDFLPPQSPRSPSFDFDEFDEDSPEGRSRQRRSGVSSIKGDRSSGAETASGLETPSQTPSRSSPDKPFMDTSLPATRPRKESAAKAKSVLENIHQQRSHYDLALLEPSSQKKLPFDTTSLRDLVTRAGVVTRALKEIVRQAERFPRTPDARPATPPDPPFSQIFQSPTSPTPSKSPRTTQSRNSGNYRGGTLAGNDNEFKGHMKVLTAV